MTTGGSAVAEHATSAEVAPFTPGAGGLAARPAAPAERPVEASTPWPFGRLAVLVGAVCYKRQGGQRWFRASEGMHFASGDVLDTKAGRCRLDTESGAKIYLNANTAAVLEPAGLRLAAGEAFCMVAGAGRDLAISTADAVMKHLGTRYSVKVTAAGTVVVVEEGSVEVVNDKGRRNVPAGQQLELHKSRAPGTPRPVDAAKAHAWVDELRALSRQKALRRYDFEDGLLPRGMTHGKVVAGPPPQPANMNRHAASAVQALLIFLAYPFTCPHIIAARDIHASGDRRPAATPGVRLSSATAKPLLGH